MGYSRQVQSEVKQISKRLSLVRFFRGREERDNKIKGVHTL